MTASPLGLERQVAVVLLGPRRVGKTTLAREIAAAQNGALYLNLEISAERLMLGKTNAFVARQFRRLTMIDEVSKLPSFCLTRRSD